MEDSITAVFAFHRLMESREGDILKESGKRMLKKNYISILQIRM